MRLTRVTFELGIDSRNAAIVEDPVGEIDMMLAEVRLWAMSTIAHMPGLEDRDRETHIIRDANGNRVGRAVLSVTGE